MKRTALLAGVVLASVVGVAGTATTAGAAPARVVGVADAATTAGAVPAQAAAGLSAGAGSGVASAASWQLAVPETAGAFAGSAVAVSGPVAVVGVPGRDSARGAAYVFARKGAKWPRQAVLTASHGAVAADFGDSVAVSGSVAVVGAPFYKQGVAYVFARNGTKWLQQAVLAAPRGAGPVFATSVAVSGSTAVIGAPGSADGAAYVFVRKGTKWSQQARLTASDGAKGALGNSVAVSGSMAVVGAPGGNSGTGVAYVFVREGTAWSQQAALSASGGAKGDSFGNSVAVSGPVAVVGAPGRNTDAGAAYVFVRKGATWSQQTELKASDAAAGDSLGWSVAASGSVAVLGAPGRKSSTGAAYLFARSGSTWSQLAELTDPAVAGGDFFGVAVAMSGSTAVIGASGANRGAGAAYIVSYAEGSL